MASPAPRERYQAKPFKYSSHYWIGRLLAGQPGPLRILDAGTAGGHLGRALRPAGHHLMGIESQPEWAAQARPHYDGFAQEDLERYAFPERNFDYVVFADILEHLRDPLAVLSRAAATLSPSGKFLISVPNVAHLTVRMGLLAGRFDYADRGILDRTHLRFFTLRSLRQLVREAHCRLLDVKATIAPVQFVFPTLGRPAFAPLHELHYALAWSWKTLWAYQFVITAGPAGGASV